MGRAPRPVGEGLTHHVMTRGNNRRVVFEDDLDRRSMLALIDWARQDRGWQIHAWCLMSNHLHLLMTAESDSLSDGMRDVLGRYTRRYNHFHGRTGHLFSGRFRSVLVTSDAQLLTTFRYVNRNPVTAGLVPSPERYPWSGFGLRGVPSPPIHLDDGIIRDLLHPVPHMADRQLRTLVCAEVTPSRAGRPRPSIGALIQALGPIRGAVAARDLGYDQRQIATILGMSESALSRRLSKRRAS